MLCKNSHPLPCFTPLVTPPPLWPDGTIHGEGVARDGYRTSLRNQRLSDGLRLRHRPYASGIEPILMQARVNEQTPG